ncbi:MAG: ParB/RepB/Spo0J family partition protein [Candidatus Nitrosocaldus sp.]
MLVNIDVDVLKSVDHVVTLSTHPLIRSIADELKRSKDASSIQPIVVGEVNGEYYILDGYARVQACRMANVKSIRAYVIKLNSKEDAQIWHIRFNIRSTLNVLKLYEAIKSNVNDEDYICSKYGMDRMMVRLLQRLERIKGRAYTKLQMYMNSIIAKFNRIPSIPYYIIVLISELDDEELQEKAVDFAFINIDDDEDIFSFQDYDRMLAFIKMLRSSYKRKHCSSFTSSNAIDVNCKVLVNASRIKNKDKDKYIYFRCSCGTFYSIDTKRCVVNRAEENEHMIVLKDVEHKTLHIVPEEVVETLKLDEYGARWYIVDGSETIPLIKAFNCKAAVLTCNSELI